MSFCACLNTQCVNPAKFIVIAPTLSNVNAVELHNLDLCISLIISNIDNCSASYRF